MRRREHVTVDLEDPTVFADVKRPARGKPARAEHPIPARHGAGDIAENRIVDSHRRRERVVGVRPIDAGAEHAGPVSAQVRSTRAEGPTFHCAPAGERLRKPGDHHRFTPAAVAQPVRAAVAGRQLEIRRQVARAKRRALGLASAGLCGQHSREPRESGYRARNNRAQHHRVKTTILIKGSIADSARPCHFSVSRAASPKLRIGG